MTTTSTETDWRTRHTDCARCGRTIRRSGHTRPNQCCGDCKLTDPYACRQLMGEPEPTPPPPPDSFDHGLSGYNNHRCRCDTCKAAKAASRPVVHGASRYSKHGCRCNICSEAERERGRQRRARKAAA